MSSTYKWIASVRTSLDELEKVINRMDDKLDEQMGYIEWLEEFAPKAGEYNTSWDAYELAKGIHWTQMESEEE
tara:strand:- start:210 stop:428 length:219 start_codon:yes stop_codon:yes gene_type:complete